MNWIKEARESIGWDQSLLAANLYIDVAELNEMESHDPAQSSSIDSRIQQVLEQRGVKFERGNGGLITSVIGPLDDEQLVAIRVGREDKAYLDHLATLGPFGERTDRPVPAYAGLRGQGLIQLGAITEVANFEEDRVSKNVETVNIRLSKKGRAWVRLQERMKAQRFRS